MRMSTVPLLPVLWNSNNQLKMQFSKNFVIKVFKIYLPALTFDTAITREREHHDTR
jgi:hypothetical protein